MDDLIEKDKNGDPIDLEECFEEWQVKILKKLNEWFPKNDE